MEKRQRSEDGVVPLGVQKSIKLGHISKDVAMTQDNALGFARTAAGEKQNGLAMPAFFRNA